MRCSGIAFLFIAILQFVSGLKIAMHPAVNVCKRNDPNIEQCFCENLKTMIPIIKDGVPEMTLPAIDPFIMDKVFVDLRQTHTIQLVGTLINVSVAGLMNTKVASCKFKLVETGVEAHVDFNIPVITVNSLYNASGTFTMLKLDATGDCFGEFKDLFVKTSWTSSKFTKNGKPHLNISAEVDDFRVKSIKLHFNKLFGNNTEMNESINNAIADNIDLLYNEVKPIGLEIITAIVLHIINHTSEAFSFDSLFPLE